LIGGSESLLKGKAGRKWQVWKPVLKKKWNEFKKVEKFKNEAP